MILPHHFRFSTVQNIVLREMCFQLDGVYDITIRSVILSLYQPRYQHDSRV